MSFVDQFLKIYPHEHTPGCPYYELAETYGGPNINWCESPLCSYVMEPANAWSNLGYIAIGLFIIFKAYKSLPGFKYFGWAVLLTGIWSMTYHMSNFVISQYFDFLGMFLMLSAITSLNFRRAGITATARIIFNIIFNLGMSALFWGGPLVNFPVQLLVVIGVGFILASEFMARKAGSTQVSFYPTFIISLGFFGLGQVFSALDLHRIMCDPDNHIIQGHALWHICGALGFYFSYLYYKQFKIFKTVG